ncbi:hypothetical protein DPMN_095740 [Dreissena polymorpha]|uniref:Myb/SANT-like DNA-binding domain-containing protein n=1 Tax=Dreissena polymorpha TaxID=45954 RepID=A0A9D4L8J5_DREPO|nr:hypothetical protein DPMN_095740 [Dreissena polymorpha]
MWDTISINFKEQGYNFSTEQISGRWKSLIRAYKCTKNNKKSGSSRKNFEYESEIDELFENDPTIEPEAVLSSGTVAAKQPANEDDEEGEVGTSSSSSTSTQQPAKKKLRSKSGELVSLFKSYLDERKEKDKEEKERRKQMHSERLHVMNSLIAAISTHNRVNNQANQPPSRSWPRNEWDPTLP